MVVRVIFQYMLSVNVQMGKTLFNTVNSNSPLQDHSQPTTEKRSDKKGYRHRDCKL